MRSVTTFIRRRLEMSYYIYSTRFQMKKTIKLMSILIMLILFFMCYVTCRPDYTEESDFVRLVNQKRMLKKYAIGALNSEGAEKDKFLKLFFKSFPDDFVTFHKIYGSHDINYPWSSRLRTESIRVIYGSHEITYPPDLQSSGYMLHDILTELYNVVPIEEYYKKKIGVGVGGFWEADAVGALSHHLWKLIPENVALSIKVLEEYEDKEIRSFWYFLYDGPHPEHRLNREHYEALHPRVRDLNPEVAEQLKLAYEQLLSEYDGHGH